MKISPLFNCGVFFLSDRLLHYTLPPAKEGKDLDRWLLTIWLDGNSVDAKLGDTWPPLLQRTIAPAVYSELFMECLERSMPPGPALDALRAAQLEEIRSLETDESFAEMLPDLREAAGAGRICSRCSSRKRERSSDVEEVELRCAGKRGEHGQTGSR